MTLLYRSPNIVIDDHEWHITVRQATRTKRVVTYRFRKIGAKVNWQPITKWSGRPPKGMSLLFGPYRKSVQVALGEIQHARQIRHLEAVGQQVAA